jgi:hypothetical protein
MHRPLLPVVLLLLLAAPALALDGEEPAARRVFILDGSMVHDVGTTHLNVTNWGLIGSRPGLQTDYSSAPSLDIEGVDHLWAAGLWVGGIVDGERRVSTGQFSPELLADPDDPADVIYASVEKAKGQRRFPAGHADDDNDGLEDEDPLDGRDNDGDGRIDEDGAAIGDQYFRAVLRDDTPLAADLFPDHEPMGLEVVQESFQFRDPDYDDLVGFRFTITNVGRSVIERPCVGLFADCDIGSAENDLAKSFSGNALANDGSTVDLTVGYAHSNGLDTGAYAGVVVRGTTSLQIFSGQRPFDQGGDPVNDAQRYQAMEAGTIDPSTTVPEDIRMILAVGPRDEPLAPGESITVDVAFVVGETEEALLANAASAVKLAKGAFLRRGGVTAHVPWYEARGRGRVADASRRLRLDATPTPFNPRVQLQFELAVSGRARLEAYDVRGRHVATILDADLSRGLDSVVWGGMDRQNRPVASGVYFFRLEQAGNVATARAVIVR